MRKLERQMWNHILNRTAGKLMKGGNLEILPFQNGVVINLYGCRLVTIEPFKSQLKLTFKGECWDGASSTVMSRVRALCVGYKVTKSGSDVTFTSECESKLSNSLCTTHLSEKGYSLLVDLAKVRLAIQP